MLDIHPAHRAASTWRDFFIHIATITVGLLIAVALEQAIEALHHRHQLHLLEADLHQEAIVNRDLGRRNLIQIDRDLSWLLQLRASVDAVRGGAPRRSFVYPTLIHGYPGDPADNDRILPNEAVWNAARQKGLVDLLPRDEALLYTKFYRVSDIYDDGFARLRDDWRKLTAFEFQFQDGRTDTQPDVQRMSTLELDQYTAVLGEVFVSARDVKRHLQIQIGWNDSVIELRAPIIGEYLRTHPDRVPDQPENPERPSNL
jgi:hypothetical protein